MLRLFTVSMVAFLAAAPTLQAQGLRDQLTDLFTFGTCGKPLCLDLGNGHGNHFLPAVAAGQTSVIGFVTEAVAQSASSIPISATSSGATYSIVDGLPVRTSTSAGPIFGERPQTLGRGRFFIGTNVSAIHYTTLNGAPTDGLQFTFSHENVGGQRPSCLVIRPPSVAKATDHACGCAANASTGASSTTDVNPS